MDSRTLIALIIIVIIVILVVWILWGNQRNIAGVYIGEYTFPSGSRAGTTFVLNSDGTFNSVGRLEFPNFIPGFEDNETALIGVWEPTKNGFKCAGIQYRNGNFPEAFGWINPEPGPVSTAPFYTLLSVIEFNIDNNGNFTSQNIKAGVANSIYKPGDPILPAFDVSSLVLKKATVNDFNNFIQPMQ